MKIDVRTNHFYSSHHQTRSSARTDDIPSFAAAIENTALDRRPENGGFTPDFTDMSREEMRGWINDQIQAGTMTLDESTPFMLMTMKIPVGGTYEIAPAVDNERIDFTARAREGIEGALINNDVATAIRLQAALDLMS